MPNAENRLIELLPTPIRQRLLAQCEPVVLVLDEVLHEAAGPVPHVYFPIDGFVSLVARVDDHPSLEVGMIGREGMLGTHFALGVDTAPMRALVQGGGAAWRMEVQAFKGELRASAALRRMLARYVHVLMSQLVAAATCQRFHALEPRLARWLLMSQDRAHAERFRVTHEFLAAMLGVRRVGVTVAASNLQRRGLIAYRRGELTVVDRAGLEGASCSCYASGELSYAQVMT